MKRKVFNKGFTLIELLAVIVILAILMLVAGSNVFEILRDAEKGSFRTEFLSLLETAQTRASLDILENKINGSRRTACYEASDLSFDTKGKDYKYRVVVEYQSDGTLKITGRMSDSKYQIVDKDVTLTKDDVIATTDGSQIDDTCPRS